jgi:hypothetical protein
LKTITMMALYLIFAGPNLVARAQSCKPAEHEEWMGRAVTEIATVKVGMTRSDLLNVFTPATGFFTTTKLTGTYVYKTSPYIRVDVEFNGSPDANKNTAESPRDTIKSISKPYLAAPTYD